MNCEDGTISEFRARHLPETRWQRTARYGWDKGGSKGGR
jgi:hypothetical protein